MATSNKNESRKVSGKTTQAGAESEDFEVVIENAPVMLWLTNTDGEIIFTNSRWKQFVGVKSEHYLTGNAWYEALHEDDREDCLRIFRKGFMSRQTFEMEYRLRRSDGEYRYVYDRGEPHINKDGEFAGFIGSSTDITEQKKSENQLRRSQRELTKYNQEMQLINEMNSYLQVSQTFEETHAIVGEYLSKLFAGSTGALYLFNDERTTLEAVSHWGKAEDHLNLVIAPGDCWALRQSRMHVASSEANSKLKCNHLLVTPEHGCICAPAIAQGEVIGFLCLEFNTSPNSEDETAYATSVESQTRIASITIDNLSMALVSLKLREELRVQSVMDPLTHLFNRRYMEETLNRELSRCKRSGLSLGVIMMDVDLFKDYNDKYGHDVGDQVLREVAAILHALLRDSDIACRYGGEEFILVIPNASKEIVCARAEEVRRQIEQKELRHDNELLTSITVSLGVALFPEHSASPDELVNCADTALYKAKQGGRNRVVVAA